MSQTIDNQIVKMQFDNSGFEKGAQQSISTLDKLKQALHFDKVNMTPLQQAFAETEATATKAGFNIRDIWIKVASTIEDQVANKIVEAGKKVFNALSLEGVTDGFKEYELKMGSIQTIMAGTGESLATVNRYLEELNTYSDQTIYSFSDMTQNIGKFTNAGVKLKDAVAAIKGIANEAAVSGANANEASRAMYNFSQALSAGFVKLIDWKSIENANMATKEFKQTLIDVAQGVGTVIKVGEDWKTTTENAQGKVSDLFNATKGFNDSLNHQWMTTEVLTGALKIYATDIRKLSDDELKDYEKELKEVYHLNADQIEQYEKLGIKAADSATEIKTFTMLIDTLKEAIGSGWATTWQYFIGDFEQAKALFTQVGNTLGDMINQMSATRNAFIKSGLQTGWEKFTTVEGMAIPESEEFREILLDVAKAHGVLTKEQTVQITSTEKLVKSFHELGWVTGDLLSESVGEYTKTLQSMTKEERDAAGITDEQMRQLEKFNNVLSDTSVTGKLLAASYAQSMKELGGRENIIEGLKNLFHALRDSITPIGEAFDNVFGVMDPQKLYNLTKRFKEFTEQMKVSGDAANTIKTSFTLAFTGIKTVIGGVATAINGVTKLILPMLNLFDAVFGVIGKVISALTGSKGVTGAANKLTKVGDKIGGKYLTIMQKFADAIDKVAEAIRGVPDSTIFVKVREAMDEATNSAKDFAKSFSEMPVVQRMVNDFNESIANIQKKLEPVAKYIEKTLEDAKLKLGKFFSFETLNKNLTFIYDKVLKFIDVIKDFASRVKRFFTDLKEGKNVVESFKENFGYIIDKINELKQTVTDFFDNLFAKGEEMDGKFDLEKIQEAIHNFVTNITPDQITMIAVAGTFMLIAANLLRLSSALRDAVDAFTGIGVALKNVINSYVKKQKSTILQIAESIVIVAAALWVLAQVPKDKLDNAVGALKSLTVCLGVLTVILALCGVALKKWGDGASMVKLAASLAIIAGSFMAAALSLKVLEYVDLEGVLPKVLLVTAILGVLATLAVLIKKLDKFSKGALTIVSLAGALFLTAASLERIGSISSENLDKSMSILLKLMLGLAAVTFAAGKVGVLSAVGLIGVILALDKIIPAIERLVNYDYTSINDGLEKNKEMVKKIGGIIAVMVAVGAIAGNRIKGTAVAMLALSATFAVMLGVAKLAGQMKPTELARGEAFLFKMGVILSLIEAFSAKSRLTMFGGKNGGEGTKAFTRIAVAMGIMLVIAKLASKMSVAEIAKGEAALVGLVGIVWLMQKIAKESAGVKGAFSGINVMLFAITSILAMIAILSLIPMENMKSTLAAVLAIMGSLAILAAAVSKNNAIFDKTTQAKASSAVPLAISVAMIAVLGALMVKLSKEDPQKVAAAAASLVAIIGAISLFSRSFASLKISSGEGQFGVFAVAVAMMLLAGATISALSWFMKKCDIDPNAVLSAAGAIAAVLTGLSPVLAAMSKFEKGDTDFSTAKDVILMAIGALIGVAGSIALLNRFGGDSESMVTSATAIAIGLLALCAPMAVLGAVGNFVSNVDMDSMKGVILGAIASLAAVSVALIAVTNLTNNPDQLITSAKALAIGLVAISVPIAVLGAVGKLCSDIEGGGLGAMGIAIVGAIAALWAISKILIDFANNIDVSGIEKLNDSLPALVAAVAEVGVLALAISASGLIAGGNVMTVVAGVGAIIGAIVALAAIIEAIALLGAAIENSKYHGEALTTGLDTLIIVFNKIGEAFGALISGFANGLLASADSIADRLVSFSEKMVPFSENMKKISAEAVDGCKNLAAAMLYLTASSFLEGIGRLIGLGKIDFNFGPLGTAIVEFANSVSSLSEDTITKADLCSRVAKKLVEVEGSLEAKGGLAKMIFGDKDLKGFAEGISGFGTAIKAFCDSVSGLPENAVQLAQNAADATAPIIEINEMLTAHGGILQHVIGEKDLKAFGETLTNFAISLTAFVIEVSALNTVNPRYPELIQKVADATTPLINLANGLENMGGKIANLVGDNTLDRFGDTLSKFATGLTGFVEEIAPMAKETPNFKSIIISVAEATTSLVTLTNGLENMGGVVSAFTGDNTLSKLGDDLRNYGWKFKEFVEYIAGLEFTNLNAFIDETYRIIELSKASSNMAKDAFVVLMKDMQDLSKMPLYTIASNWKAQEPTLIATIAATFNKIVALVVSRTSNDRPKYRDYGVMIPTAISEGVKDTYELTVYEAIKWLVEQVFSYFNEYFKSEKFEKYGEYIVAGISQGISAHADDVRAQAQALADEVTQTIENALKIASPSKVMRKIGMFIDQGLAIGIRDYTATVVESANTMSDEVISTANLIISAIAASLDENMDMQPTIRPVLDTTDLVRGARNIGSLFNSSDLQMAYGISSAVKANHAAKYATAENPDSQNANGSGTQINFTQNNYSPKELSRMDIYRQTRNQLNMMKGVVKANA